MSPPPRDPLPVRLWRGGVVLAGAALLGPLVPVVGLLVLQAVAGLFRQANSAPALPWRETTFDLLTTAYGEGGLLAALVSGLLVALVVARAGEIQYRVVAVICLVVALVIALAQARAPTLRADAVFVLAFALTALVSARLLFGLAILLRILPPPHRPAGEI